MDYGWLIMFFPNINFKFGECSFVYARPVARYCLPEYDVTN